MADDFSRILNEVHAAQSSQNSFVMVHPITNEVMEGIGDGPLKWGEYPDTIEPGTDESYQYDIFRSKFRPYPSDILAANSIGEITEQPEGSQINDPYWQIASRIMYEYTKTKQGDKPVDEFSAEEMAQWGVSFMNSFENNIPAMVINTVKLQDAPPEVSRAMYYLLETSDRDGILGSNILESAGQMLIDPSTWIGLGTFGIGLAGRETGKALSKMGLKELLKNSITTQSVKTSTLALAGESAFFGAVDNLARQEVAIEAEQQDGLDLQQLGTTAAISGALGETLGTLGPAALEGSKRVVREIGERLNAPGNMPTVGSNLGNVADFKAPTEKEPGIIAFHGSKNDFNEFKLQKIGSGEGAQAFGYGLYFTDSEDIAKFYKDSTTEVPFDYQLDGRSVNKLYNDALNNENYELAEVLEQVQLHESPKELAERFSKENGYSEEIQEFVKNLNYDRLKGVNADGENVPLGRIYKVVLAPKEEDLLDYDASFSEQSKPVQNKLLKAGYKINPDTDGSGSMILDALMTSAARKELAPRDEKLKEINSQLNILSKEIDKYSISYGVFSDPKGKIASDKYNALLDERAKLPSQNFKKGDASKIVSEELSKVGIPGIKYKANRGTGDRDVSSSDPNNYVIFDDKLISIMKKYGIVGPVAVTAQTLSKSNNEQDSVNKEPQT